MGHKDKLQIMNRLQIKKDSGKDISIEISPLKDKVSKTQLMFLIFGLIGLLIALSQINSEGKPFAKLFLIVWSIIGIFFLIKIWNVLKWRRFGKEIIKVSGEQLILIKTCPLNNHSESFNIQDSRIVKNDYQISPTKEFFKVHPGVFKVENKRKSTMIGKYLNYTESNQLAEELKTIGLKSEYESTVIDETEISDTTDKYSKKHVKRIRRKIFLICLIPAFLYGYSEFKKNTNEYILLKSIGEVAEVTSEFRENWDTDYYYFYFIASNGQKVESSGKCGDKERFDSFYKNLKVVYNPSNPEQYMEYPYFEDYSVNYKIFFYLILMTLIIAGIGSTFITMIYLAIKGQKITPHTHRYMQKRHDN